MKGFVAAFDKIEVRSQRTAYEALKTLIADSSDASEVFLTGHSLGGAIAVVFAMLLSIRQATGLNACSANHTDCLLMHCNVGESTGHQVHKIKMLESIDLAKRRRFAFHSKSSSIISHSVKPCLCTP